MGAGRIRYCVIGGLVGAGATAIAIVPAAGLGARIEHHVSGGRPKALLEVAGKSIIGWTLQRLLKVSQLSRLIVLVPPLWEEHFIPICRDSRVQFVTGGASRTESVARGLRVIGEETLTPDLVLIHDAARCLVSTRLVQQTIEMGSRYGAATAALPMVDTVRRGDDEGFAGATVPRDGLWRIQTPQVFRYDLLVQAYDSVNDFSGNTDDAGVVGAFAPVKYVNGDPWNLKVTFAEDLKVARILLQEHDLDTPM